MPFGLPPESMFTFAGIPTFEALEFLQQPAILTASLEYFLLKSFLTCFTGGDFQLEDV